MNMLNLQDFVDARLYENEEDVLQDALRHLLRGRADLRVRLAIHRYQTDAISLAKAASLAGVSWAQMKDILQEQGVDARLGPDSADDARREVDSLRDHLSTP